MGTLILYSYYRSSSAYRVRIALHFKKIPFQYQAVHLIKSGGEQFQEEFKKQNPFCQVPVLKHEEKILSQSLPILLYLEELQPQTPLLPKDSFQKAKILSFCEGIGSGIQPLQNLSVLKYLEKEIQADKFQWSQFWITQGLKSCEDFLKPHAKTFCFGETLSFADLFLIPQMYNAKRFKVDTKKLPLLESINEQCLKLPAFQKALPENQADAPK